MDQNFDPLGDPFQRVGASAADRSGGCRPRFDSEQLKFAPKIFWPLLWQAKSEANGARDRQRRYYCAGEKSPWSV
jgi:hypothetical protein